MSETARALYAALAATTVPTAFGRSVSVLASPSGVARASFDALCGDRQPLGAADYIALAERFHTLVVLHPVFETVGGPHRFMLGLQIEFDFGDDEGVIERIVALERTLALMPRTLDGSHEADRQRVAGASLLRRGEAGSAGGGSGS